MQHVLYKTVATILHDLRSTDITMSAQPLLVAVSGGVDSMVLFHLLHEYSKVHGQPIVAMHVNHGLRETAARDEQLVVKVCQEYGVPLEIHSVTEEERGGRSTGIESAARQWRRTALISTARKVNSVYILMAHHANDQVETVLWRWLRGSSMRGLAGMRKVHEAEGVNWVRPLLSVSRSEIEQFAVQHDISFHVDETNLDTTFTRNYLRQKVIPLLQHVQPRIHETVTRMSEVLRAEDDYLHECATRMLEDILGQQANGRVQFSVVHFLTYPRPLQRRAIQIILYCFASVDWTFSHTEDVLELMCSNNPSGAIDLPGGLVVQRKYSQITFSRQHPAALMQAPDRQTWQLRDGSTFVYRQPLLPVAWHFFCQRWRPGEGLQRKSKWETCIPAVSQVSMGSVATSERITRIGRGGTKKMQDIYTDAKVPKQLRTTWPTLRLQGAVVWVPGVVRSNTALLQPSSHDGWVVKAIPPEMM